MQAVTSFFEAERSTWPSAWPLPRSVAAGAALDAPMEAQLRRPSASIPADTTGLEDYLKEYYDTILKRLREMEADLDKDAKKKLPF
jgi:hypothetical protein